MTKMRELSDKDFTHKAIMTTISDIKENMHVVNEQ